MNRRQFNLRVGGILGSLIIPPFATTAAPFNITNIHQTEQTMYDVIIVGGSYAGLSAALTLGRSLRNVLLIDSGKPCNRFTPHAHNFITHDGKHPAEIAQAAKSEVLNYSTVTFQTGLVVKVLGQNGNFKVSTTEEQEFTSKKLLFATGVKDLMPELTGLADCWGISVLHCPYCHGYEVKSKATGILMNHEMVVDYAKLIQNWTQDLTVYTNGKAQFDTQALLAAHIKVDERPIQALVHQNGYLERIEFVEGLANPLEALYYRPAFEQHCPIPAQLGCKLTEQGHLAVNEFQQTNLAGIYAVGDATTPFRSLSIAAASGTKAGSFLNHELLH